MTIIQNIAIKFFSFFWGWFLNRLKWLFTLLLSGISRNFEFVVSNGVTNFLTFLGVVLGVAAAAVKLSIALQDRKLKKLEVLDKERKERRAVIAEKLELEKAALEKWANNKNINNE